MSKTIKLEIPAEPEYQAAAAAFFNTLTGEGVDHRAVTTEVDNANQDDTPPPPPPAEDEDTDNESLFENEEDDTPPPPPPADDVKLDEGRVVDSEGFPHDERIHSSGRDESGQFKQYATGPDAGKWQRRRGVSPETTTQVKDELRAEGYGAPATAATADDTPPPPPPADDNAESLEHRTVSNFPELMALVQTLKAAGKINDAQLNEQATAVAGVPNVALMATKADLIPALGDAIQAVAAL